VDATIHPTLATDAYIVQQRPKSLLCIPILNQGKLVAILYLENHITLGAFTSDRVELLNFLCAQASISLENARLYQQSQTYAQQIQESQLQIVQSEKMASLGNLVAGVAHEINNPIGFLNGSINNAKEYVKDLLDHLELYQQHCPNAAASVQDHAEEIDLEFLREDLPKLLTSMKGATDRIKGISTSLRTFSRADTEHKVSANLHEGIDSTLLILKYRIKGNEHRPDIQIIQDYDDLPPIECFPGQLNQVFMNILANSIDMFDEMAQSLSLTELKASPQNITIRTRVEDKKLVKIQISDNGKGMPETVRAKVFDHLFTTKGVGQGTGLGLAIARQIVVEKHGGSLEVQSALGQGTEFCIRLPMGAVRQSMG
jgi:signal transduction histidine kinase